MRTMWREIRKATRNPRKAIRYAYSKRPRPILNSSIFINSVSTIGTPIFSKEWDLLIILDTCRVDIAKEVMSEYDFIGNVNKTWSVGSQSAEWIAKTFDRKWTEDLENTGYITANPHSETVLENRMKEHFRDSSWKLDHLRRYGKFNFIHPEELGYYKPVWKTSDPELEGHDLYGAPRKITDQAIRIDRNKDLEKLILHYMPPHKPYIINALNENREPNEYERNPMGYLKKTGDIETIWAEYKDMLRWVLDEVELLLENMDRENVVITADHGEGFGEYRTYGHPVGSLNPVVRTVPWIETMASDSNSYKPDPETTEENNISSEERLEALGYI